MSLILVADDDPHQLTIRQMLLQAAGFDVHIAIGPGEVARSLQHGRPDLLMLDLKFPNAQGEADVEVGLQLIRTVQEMVPGLPVIVLSGWPEALEGRAESKLVSCVLAKPCRMETLLEAIRSVVAILVCLLLAMGTARAETRRFTVSRRAEVVADLELSSPGSDWSKPGREASLANVSLDGSSPQHVMLYAGERRHTYPAFLGMLEPGEHTLTIERNEKYSAAASGLRVHETKFREVAPGDPDWTVLSRAPVLFARADTVGLFTDVPMIAYCERLVEDGKPYLQYTVIFSNEDGGTSTRALMARWGRTTDIEYIYKAWLGPSGGVTRATIQAKDHKEIDFDGRYDGTHPVLIPSTRNNMVSGQGSSDIRYQIAPVLVDLSAHSREQVMDDRPFSYRVMSQELVREGKLRPFGAVQGQRISDPRNYLYVDIKVDNQTSSLGLAVHLKGESLWRSSHLGRPDYGITRDGWVRTTVELPPGTRPGDLAEIGFECMVEPAKPENLAGTCRVGSVGKVFFLDSEFRPGTSVFSLSETLEIPSGQMRTVAVVPPHVAAATSTSGHAQNRPSAFR